MDKKKCDYFIQKIFEMQEKSDSLNMEDEEMVLKVGDTVLYGKYAGTEIELDGEKYIIMRQSDVLAII